ncbi:prolyl oligopeptidase family serine peptidase [Streptomyces chrestomyceticus]|uniref:prolyl oligopeptidase family serine peptidase n=1 Tax=Streptomyces chrestomyceticus TaxID=68185 RepID=UPI0023AF8861|nr:prolyl oligopeptidase family serine peptidase [Streptomyces chrestomyceticus]
MAIAGTSNGGLLVAAAAVQQPQLYAAAPLLDMVRYERFGLGPVWAHEYGSASDPEQVEGLLSYSPYHHACEGREYPAMLLSAFDNDTRADPLHACKTCAALQYATADPSSVLLRCEAERASGPVNGHSPDRSAVHTAGSPGAGDVEVARIRLLSRRMRHVAVAPGAGAALTFAVWLEATTTSVCQFPRAEFSLCSSISRDPR